MTECISERLLARLRHLGRAYELTLLARLPTYGEVAYYPEIQLGLLEDELAFLFEVVSDQALLRAVDPIVGLIHHAHRNPRGWWLWWNRRELTVPPAGLAGKALIRHSLARCP